MNGRRPEGRPAAASGTGFADRKLPRRAPSGALRRGTLKDIHRYCIFHGLGANTLFMPVFTELFLKTILKTKIQQSAGRFSPGAPKKELWIIP
jgi:hypothetical protein